MPFQSRTEMLTEAFERYGLLLLNEHPSLPSVAGVGGDWKSLMDLIEARAVFYSKVYKNRVAYLSRDMYFRLKLFRQVAASTETERRIYQFLSEVGEAEKEEIQSGLMLSKEAYNTAMDGWFQKLGVTAIRRGRALNEQWSTLYWGTDSHWEAECPEVPVYSEQDSISFIYGKLQSVMPAKQIKQLLGNRSG